MSFVQSLTLLTSSNAKWTTTQEKAIARDYPFTDVHLETPDQFVVRTYLQFLWLPESIMPIGLLVPSLHRVQDASPQSPDTPHPLHAFLDPLLLSLRSVVAKYHTELPQILALDGGGGEVEESMMWYALGYETGETGETGEGCTNVNNEDAIMLEEKSRNMWLERLERREVQIQILLYLLKLSLPGLCPPLPRVKIPVDDVVPSTKKKRQKTKSIVPSAYERLESFMDKLSMWQLLLNMNDSNKSATKDERDWMQSFCEGVVERQFKSTLPDMCALLRRKLFPYSPFSDDDDSGDSDTRSNPDTQATSSTHPRPDRKLTRYSTSTSVTKSKGKPNPVQRSSSVLTSTTASDTRSRSRSLSVSLAQDATARRSGSTSGTSSSLRRALSREVSMSRAFKPRVQHSRASQPSGSRTKTLAKSKEAKKDVRPSQGITLVAATPTKPKVRGDSRNHRQASSQSQHRAFTPEFDTDDDDTDDLADIANNEGLTVEEEELWLPNSSPDILLLGARKRTASSSSSSKGLSDPAEEGGLNTPVKKRLRI